MRFVNLLTLIEGRKFVGGKFLKIVSSGDIFFLTFKRKFISKTSVTERTMCAMMKNADNRKR